MRTTGPLACLAFLAFLASSPAVQAAAPSPMLEGLVEVDATRVDKAWILPDAGFASYTKVMIDPAQVAFRKNWMRNINQGRGTSRISQKDAEEIAAAGRESFDEIFADAFRKGGYEVTTQPGADVLRISPSIADVYINAPAKLTEAGSRIYSVEAGEAVLVLTVSDSPTGAVLGVAMDRREAGDHGGRVTRMDWRTKASNRADFERMFSSWAQDAVNGLNDLRAAEAR